MGFVKTLQELMTRANRTADFYNAEALRVFWETRPEIVARLLPPPLEPARTPLVMAFAANYPETNFGAVYKESALFLRASYQGEEGNYCLAMPVTDDMAMAGGREVFGFPKKMADIHIAREGESVVGWTLRRGIRFMEIRARLTGRCNDPAAEKLMTEPAEPDSPPKRISYLFKHFPAPEGGAFDYNPRLVRQETVARTKETHIGEAEIILTPSPYDPWSEVEVVKPLGAVYTIGDNSMLAGKVIGEVDLLKFLPYAFLKWDMP